MTQNKWIDARSVAERYGASEKWPWYQQKIDPNFPREIKISGGMTRWSVEQLDRYDEMLKSK